VSGIELDHIAIATYRLTDAPPLLVGVLGGVPYFGQDAEVFRFGQWEFDGDGRIEVLEPRGADGEGTPAIEDGTRVYRWPRSPLRIAVEIDATAEEGPICIDVASPRPVTPLDTPATALGTVFSRRRAP
jgi:hypothetical protein